MARRRRDGSMRTTIWLIILVVALSAGLFYVVFGLKPPHSNSSPPPSEAPLTTQQVEQVLAKSNKYHRTPESNAEHPYPADWTDTTGRVTFTIDQTKVTLYILFDNEAGVDCTTLFQWPRSPITLAEQLQQQQRDDLLEKGCSNY